MSDLRTSLRLDAAASGGLGLLLLALAGVIDGPLGLSTTFCVVVGLALLGWAAFVLWVAGTLRPAWVVDVIALNVLWVAASLVFAFAGWGGLTTLGSAFVLVQAGAVALLTVLQARGLRSTRALVPA